MNFNSKEDMNKILEAGFTVLRIREALTGSGKRAWCVWAKTKAKDWHKFSHVYTVKTHLQDYLKDVLKDSHTILEG
jgi:hypothetical protein